MTAPIPRVSRGHSSMYCVCKCFPDSYTDGQRGCLGTKKPLPQYQLLVSALDFSQFVVSSKEKEKWNNTFHIIVSASLSFLSVLKGTHHFWAIKRGFLNPLKRWKAKIFLSERLDYMLYTCMFLALHPQRSASWLLLNEKKNRNTFTLTIFVLYWLGERCFPCYLSITRAWAYFKEYHKLGSKGGEHLQYYHYKMSLLSGSFY